MSFETVPNQRRITIHKCDSKKNYSKIDKAANFKAMKTLGYSAYMLYMYLCLNATDYNLILSKVATCTTTSLSKNVYYEAFNKLVDAGYLVPKPETKCLFNFYEDPSLAATASPKSGKSPTQNRESSSLKQVENIYKYKNTAGEVASASSPGDENKKASNPVNNKKRIFADI